MSSGEIIRIGSHGPAVGEVRTRLALLGLCAPVQADEPTTEHLVFDESLDRAVRTFQQERGITVDGIVGPQTYRRLDEARWRLGDRVLAFTPRHLMSGDDVTELQRRLNDLGFAAGRTDGRFGPLTDSAVREFQAGVGVTADGTCGPDTYRAFERLARSVAGGGATVLREHLSLEALRTGIADKVVVIDPGDDVGRDICHAVAVRVEGRLAALGTQAVLSRPYRGPAPDDVARAQFANDIGADLVVSLHVDAARSQRPNGLVSFFYGDPLGGTHSPAGRMLAELMQDEVRARTGALDCGSHPSTWDLLRLTRMPAVRMEFGYLSHPEDARRLRTVAYLDAVAEGVASAATRFCAPD